MPKAETLAYLVVIFPTKATSDNPTRLGALASDVIRALADCCGHPPTLVHPDKSKLVMLVTGEYAAIVKALQVACQPHDERWLLAQVGTPCAANGLSTADGWIRSHSQESKN